MNINTVTKIYDIDGVHSAYQLNDINGNSFHVPLDTANTDYQAIQTWIADGGTVIDNGE
jgi:hypothetical protein